MIRYIYTFFVGLFLAIFVGVGIAAFYTEPAAPEAPIFYGKELTVTEQKQEAVFEQTRKTYDQSLKHYNRNVSMIVLSSAVVILIISLALEKQLGLLADGLLLGGIFTLLYGIGRGMATDNNKYRFLVASVGLATTLILGYIKFIRHERSKA